MDECEQASVARGWCGKHYMAAKRYGDPTVIKRKFGLTPSQRFWQYVDTSGSCWVWTAGKSHGYGTFGVTTNGVEKAWQAHRFAYVDLGGVIPPNMTLDHLCHTAVADRCVVGDQCPHRACVRPEHMEIVPLRTNIKRGGNGAKVRCKRGHEFTPENTKQVANGRACVACADARVRKA